MISTLTAASLPRNAQGRTTYLRDILSPAIRSLQASGSDAEWTMVAENMATVGATLGRSAGWKATAAWALAEIRTGESPAWAVTQGLIFLAHENA